MRDSPDSKRAAVTMAPTIGIAAVALVLSFLLLSFIPLCRFISSNVNDIELNYFHTYWEIELLNGKNYIKAERLAWY
jgi:uncharacterized integral membrane protein